MADSPVLTDARHNRTRARLLVRALRLRGEFAYHCAIYCSPEAELFGGGVERARFIRLGQQSYATAERIEAKYLHAQMETE